MKRGTAQEAGMAVWTIRADHDADAGVFYTVDSDAGTAVRL